MWEKKAQISLFLLFGILLLVLGSLFYSQKNNFADEEKKNVQDSAAVSKVSAFVNQCLNKILNEGIILTAARGGDLFLTHPFTISYEDAIHTTTSAYVDKKKTLVSRDIIKENLAEYVTLQLPLCANFSSFPELTVSAENPFVVIRLEQDTISASVDWSLQITQEKVTTNVDSFFITKKTSLSSFHQKMNVITNQYILLNGIFDAVFLESLGVSVQVVRADTGWIVLLKNKETKEVWISALDTTPFEVKQ